jgi:uncharacterized protein YoxC
VLWSCAALLEQQSTETVKRLQVAVDGAIAELTSKRLQQLVLLQTSDRYLDRHVASLEMLTKQVDKSRREIASLEDKNAELIDATGKLQPQIDSLVAATKRLKRDVSGVSLSSGQRARAHNLHGMTAGSGAAALVQGVQGQHHW